MSKKIICERYVASTGRKALHIGFWQDSRKERHHWDDTDVGGATILKWMLWK